MLQNAIDRRESNVFTQEELNTIYGEFCDIVKHDIDDKLLHKEININKMLSDKRRKVKKDYWNEELDDLYKAFRTADRKWSCAHGSSKRRLKDTRPVRMKTLDRAVQGAKRAHWHNMQNNILALHSNNSKEFWKFIGRIGVGSDRKLYIPWEVCLPDGSVSRKHKVVLNHWQYKLSELLNGPGPAVPPSGRPPEAGPLIPPEGRPTETMDTGMELPITEQEVRLAVAKAKAGCATVFDELLVEVIQSDIAIYCLHKPFNKYFDTCMPPDLWAKSIINPIPKDSSNDRREQLNYRRNTLSSCVYKLYCSILNWVFGLKKII